MSSASSKLLFESYCQSSDWLELQLRSRTTRRTTRLHTWGKRGLVGAPAQPFLVEKPRGLSNAQGH